jgi:NADH-quinone oxidoreductase E subunit
MDDCCGRGNNKEARLTELFNRYEGKDGVLIPVLQKAQEIYGYLPEEVLKKIADHFQWPFSEVYGVATFYAQFHLKPRGENIIKVCTGTACHVRGGGKILDKITSELKISPGETTEDLKFTLESVACLGACGLAPVMMVNDDTYGRLTPDKVPAILAKY